MQTKFLDTQTVNGRLKNTSTGSRFIHNMLAVKTQIF